MQSQTPAARVAALWSVRGLVLLRDVVFAGVISDPHAGVRENALRLAEPRLDASADLREKVAARISDQSVRVRLQVAFSIGECRKWKQAALLARMPEMQSALILSTLQALNELYPPKSEAEIRHEEQERALNQELAQSQRQAAENRAWQAAQGY